ncbi:host attachment protein [Duganella phyllosphaerae]|uniref:Protein required for attachment to host cells n=1 Tax=Duganella phyllosphaerae TaxID=762836 RepID=A0A1E7WLX9_9BURK|nr:host attachment protein [Duganella phyllosphaerae]OFA00035.1 protein required for attachment to host cells [Duganella phyllosphaerae]
MDTTWIVTANAGRARIFSAQDPAKPLQELEDMVNPAMRLRVTETEPDKIGPTAATNTGHNIGGTQGVSLAHNAKAGAPNKAYQPAHTPAEQEAEQFARDISARLREAQQQGQFQRLVLCASPQFLGALRAVLDPHVKSFIEREINKDYTQANEQELREHLGTK